MTTQRTVCLREACLVAPPASWPLLVDISVLHSVQMVAPSVEKPSAEMVIS